MFVTCFVVHCFVSFVVLQSFLWGRKSWLHYFVCLSGVLWLQCGSSSWCRGVFSCSGNLTHQT